MRIEQLKLNKIAKRTLSFFTALLLFSGSLPMAEISEKLEILDTALVAHAVDDYVQNPTLVSAQNIIDYSKAYREYPQNHYNDHITINRSDDLAATLFDGFLPLGTYEFPFAGTITFNATAWHDINIDTAFFDYVYDYVTIDGGVDAGVNKYMTIKPTADNQQAVLANHVLHDDGSKTGAVYGSGEGEKTPATWTIEVSRYEGTSHTHGSVIGEMGQGAKVAVNLINNYSIAVENNISVDENNAITDTGMLCGVMQNASELTIASITGNAATSITSSNGNAGGLVGTMNQGSKLTISGSSSNYVSPTSSITAASGYAGGLVGSNDRATVTGSYTAIKNTVTGSLGAGGLYGYYKPIMTNSAYSLDLNSFTIGDSSTKCTVSSSIGAGGFFGVLDNPGGTITLSGTNTVYSFGSGDSTVFGGIVGTYKADSLDSALFVKGYSSTAALSINTARSNNLSYYGGVIGKVDGARFVSVEDVDISAGNADCEYFGGCVGAADEGYVYVRNMKLAASNMKGGGIVGHCANGVVHLAGASDLSAASSSSDSVNHGQIVGYRDSALIFADSTWDLTRYIDSSTDKGAAADDVGSWGEVVRFGTNLAIGDVLSAYYDPSAEKPVHYAKLKAASTTLGSKSAFALAALNMQLNAGTTSETAALQFADTSNSNYATLKNSNFTMTSDIDLSLTGITGLTRDNNVSEWESGISPEYSGTLFNGDSHKLTLAIGEGYEGQNTANAVTSGRGRIYRHRYNGLFGILTNDFTVKNLTVAGKISTYTKTSEPFYVGAIACEAKKKLNASGVTIGVITNGSSDMKIDFGIDNNKENNVEIYVGGLAGKLDAPGATIIGTGGDGSSTAEYTGTANSAFRAEIIGTSPSDKTYVGGISGYAGGGGSITLYDVEIGGKVENTSASPHQRIGGLIANVAGGSVTIDGVTASSLTISGKMGTNTISNANEKYMGGLFGYCWDADAAFDHVNISSCTLGNNNTGGDMAGLVNMGKGHWVFNSVAVNGLTLSGTSAASFGMLLNKAYSGSNAMYLELPSGFTYTIQNVSGTAPSIYDELAAYTVMPENTIEANGNSVISINTNGTTKHGTMTASNEDNTTVHMTTGSCNTYQNQVTSTGFNKYNPNSRYYYNLDNYKDASKASSLSAAEKLFMYSVKQYAHSTIQSNFASAPSTATFTDASSTDTLDLDGYSYYPFDVSGTVNISGNVALHNKDIEDRENESSGDSYLRTTIKDTTNDTSTQHYLMHAGLFRNVSGTINVNGALTIDGTVPDTDTYCGALICGTIGGSTSADATITSNNTGASISLAGIKVHNKDSTYSPLLINKASGYIVMDIYHVSADSSKYSANEQIATSLIGTVGSDTAEKVQVTFSDIKLDAREAESTLSSLTAVYGTKKCLFTRATLLESLTYASGSGSFGVYNYEFVEDWTSTHVGNVTYGKEISNSESKNYKKEFWYNNENHSSASAHYTDPSTDNNCGNSDSTAPYDFAGFSPYVAVWGTQIGSSATKHQLNVNHSSATFSGCGTYNDPYVITEGVQLESISKILSGSDDDENFWLYYPNNPSNKWCDSKTSHTRYIFKKNAFTTKEGTTVPATTNGMYYKQELVTENGESVYYVTDASMTTTVDPDVIRAYLASAYYYLEDDVEINANDFFGLGNNSNAAYVFHGVIAGNGKTITNKTASPLIHASNGCVIKNLKVDVNNSSITLSGTKNDSFLTSTGCGAYGAIIGRVFGGDNIIDQVTVDVGHATVTPTILTPVGSYIGVVVEGGVFFRNMDKVTQNVLFSGGNYAENAKTHLYCNPYIGRVISGFAVNETASDDVVNNTYAPYETGSRTLGDGTPVTGNQVSLQNNNKNYSITDIDPDFGKDQDSDFGKLTASSKTVSIPNSQAFFVMSLIINCGMGTNGTNVVGYYNANQITRHAEYNNVGTNVKLSDYSTAAEYEATDARKDYAKTANDTSTSPYLISAYATGTYAKQLGSATGFTLNVNDDIILPDGYKGIGNVFNSSSSLYIALSTFNGNNKNISQNTTFYTYTNDSKKNQDNYLPYTQNASNKNTVHGLGLFNYVNNATFQNCVLTGNVVSRQYDNGSVLNYTASTDYTALAAGGLVGTLNMSNKAYVTDVYLSNIKVESTRDAAGIIGYMINDTADAGKGIEITNTTTNTTNNSSGIYIDAGTNAAGMIARQGNAAADHPKGRGDITIDLNNHYFDYSSIVSRYNGTTEKDKWNADWTLAVGGLVGVARANDKGSNANTISISNVKIGKPTNDSLKNISCQYSSGNSTTYGNIYVGGLVGVFNRCPVTITNCEVYNVNVSSGKYAGGLVGWGGTASEINIDGCTFSNTMTAKVYSSSDNAGGVLGYCKGGAADQTMGNFTIKNSTIDGYTIEGTYAGGALGDWEAASSNRFAIQNSVISNCTIAYTTSGGGIAGQLKKNLYGYNVRVSDITFTPSGTAQQGYITGKRDGGIIKITGFHRTGTISEAKLIGNNTNNQMTDMYGSGGYVIFADYEGASTLTTKNTTASNVNLGGATRVTDFGASPYVTINPDITLDSNIGLITGDGMSITGVNSILTDSSNKKYAVADLSAFLNTVEGVTTIKSDIVSNFSSELGEVITGKTYNFPILVVNDTTTADTVVNEYLGLLTNTTLDYSSLDTTVGTVTIKKCAYTKNTGTYTVGDSACLEISNGVFKIRTDSNNKEQYDTANENGQFTLIDVAFKDPTTSSNPGVVYHLYVPVIVKKLLEYNFDISAVSGSTYDQSLYANNRGNNVVENLGAPVTMEFEYNYLRSANDWAAEDKDFYYDKYLSFDKATTAAFDSNTTKLILVDVNRGGKEYYLDKWSDGYNSTTKLLNLQAFKAADGSNFEPMTFAEMLTAQNISGTQTLKEKYYLTVFTDKYERSDPNEVKVVHYSVTSPNIGTSDHPTRRVDCTDQASGSYHYVTHLIIGDFYTNTISVMTPENATERMSNSNKNVIVNISATIDLVNNGTRQLLRDYLGKSNVTIYQSLLASFEKYNNNTLYDKGLTAIDGYSINSYTLAGQNGNIPITDQQILRTSNFIEFQNNTDISGSLQIGSITSTVQATLEFNSESTRTAQFPYRSSGQNTGALVIGYSNISSSNTNTAYSVVSVSDEDSNHKMYYVETEETADLQYYADYSNANKENQLKEQLGINAREIESNQTKSFIQTEGRYDATGLLNVSKAQYLSCSIELFQKQENGSYSDVSIDSYLDSLSVIGGKTPVYTNSTTHTYVFNIGDVEQFENEQYVYKIPITFNALTGKGTNFKDTYLYSNYKVVLTVALFDHNGSSDATPWTNAMNNSTIPDWVIYTNARVYTDLINAAS